MAEGKEVYVTEASLPPQDRFNKYVNQIFTSKWLTNQGTLVLDLENKLRVQLEVPYLSLCANGTLALQLAIRALRLNGKKVITTPYTYVATLSSLLWENCKPILVDIEPDTMCLDPQLVEEALKKDPEIAAILPVHVYGNACDVEAFDRLANKYSIPVLYDGAHAFGSLYKGKSLLSYGQAAICSFHATKIFHTVEGGCVISHSQDINSELQLLRAFGHIKDSHYQLGINAKLSELHAAMGLALLPEMPRFLESRARLTAIYDQLLSPADNPNFRGLQLRSDLIWNHAYYPLVFATNNLCLKVMESLAKEKIHARRYFYPSLSKLPYFSAQSCPLAEDISERVLCLPLWPEMGEDLVAKIAQRILEACGAG